MGPALMRVARLNAKPPPVWRGFFMCAGHARQLGGESPLSSLMVAKD